MRFSVITVSLNSGDRLKCTIKSVVSQTFGDLELIVKDGMSTDGSVESTRSDTMIKDDSRVRFITSKDSGIYDAMNQALAEAHGDYVLFLNSGDCFCDDSVLEKTDENLRENEKTAVISARSESAPDDQADIAYGDIFERTTGTVVKSNPKIDDFACFRNVPCHQACFYRRILVSEHPFDVRYKVRADYEQFLWCHFVKKAVTLYMPVTVTSYEGGGLSDSDEGRRISEEEHKEITARYIPAAKRFMYRAAMILSFSGLRTSLARNPKTARVYNSIKGFFYRR